MAEATQIATTPTRKMVKLENVVKEAMTTVSKVNEAKSNKRLTVPMASNALGYRVSAVRRVDDLCTTLHTTAEPSSTMNYIRQRYHVFCGQSNSRPVCMWRNCRARLPCNRLAWPCLTPPDRSCGTRLACLPQGVLILHSVKGAAVLGYERGHGCVPGVEGTGGNVPYPCAGSRAHAAMRGAGLPGSGGAGTSERRRGRGAKHCFACDKPCVPVRMG